MLRSFAFLFFISFSHTFFSQEGSDKFFLIDSAFKLIKTQDIKGWTVSRHGTRIVLTKTDSVLVATSYSNYKPGKPLTDFAQVKYKYQLFLDFSEKTLSFGNSLDKTVNDSLDELIKKFQKKNYGKGDYYKHFELIDRLEKMKIKEATHLKNFDIRFSDNCPADWIPYEWKDVEHLPFEPPTKFQKGMEKMKTRLGELLEEWGI
jgi:hypothetical protein